jgi:S1-C subfamily serine protease
MPGMPGAQQRGNNGVPFKGMGSGFIISADGLILTTRTSCARPRTSPSS